MMSAAATATLNDLVRRFIFFSSCTCTCQWVLLPLTPKRRWSATSSMLDAMDPAFEARYELGPLIGSGGMGAVHRALDRHLNRDVAIKLLHAHLLTEAVS